MAQERPRWHFCGERLIFCFFAKEALKVNHGELRASQISASPSLFKYLSLLFTGYSLPEIFHMTPLPLTAVLWFWLSSVP